MTRKSTNRLTAWMSLILIAHFLSGCGNTVQTRPDLPPIYPEKSDMVCMSAPLKRQLVAHNCKVDYDPKYCKTKEK